MATSPSFILSRTILRLLVALSALYAVLSLIFLVTVLFSREFVGIVLGTLADDQPDGTILFVRLLAVAFAGSALIVYYISHHLRDIVETVGAGNPFIVENARRLRIIAWSLLGLEVLQGAMGAIIASAPAGSAPITMDVGASPTRWIAVLLLFVLAGVFEHGARMRVELDATI